jgi:tRNA G18 (ribose-2'-O)-methylase SpoU
MAEDRGADVFIADAAVIDTIAGFPVHRGVLALAHRVPLQPPGLLLRGASAVVVVEGVNDHENLGSIFRNAGGLGADAVFLDPSCCDPLYRRSVRVSLGSVLRIPFTRIERWPSALTELKEHGFTLVALDPTAPATLDAAPDIGKLAVMIGSEGDGLSEDALALADRVVRIPMAPGFDSLNVATALAIGLSHLIR